MVEGIQWSQRVSFMQQANSLYIVGCRGASQLGGSLLWIPPGYKVNKLYCRVSQPGVLEPQGVRKKFHGMKIIA